MCQDSQVPSYCNYIGGQWVESVSGRTYTIINPARKGMVLGAFQASVTDDAEQAIHAAQAAISAKKSS